MKKCERVIDRKSSRLISVTHRLPHISFALLMMMKEKEFKCERVAGRARLAFVTYRLFLFCIVTIVNLKLHWRVLITIQGGETLF